MNVSVRPGDGRESLQRMIDAGEFVQSVVTDPPYGLTSVVKRFGKDGAAKAKHGTDGAFARASAGFMGKAWDGTGIERDPEFWRLVHDVLLPGGFCFAFSGARTGHWQAVAMEQAGFIMHPMHVWMYGSGMPKAHDAAKAIDKYMGVEGSSDAEKWSGWKYGTQTQKPAIEPIYLAQRPFSEKNGPANLISHGVGALNIDGCRITTSDNLNGVAYATAGNRKESPSLHGGSGMNVPGKTVGKDFIQPTGRYPANLLHDGSPAALDLFPGTAEKSASRFFGSFPPDTDIAIYAPKAGKADRAGSKHPTVKPIALMRYLIRHVTPPGGTVLDPFAGSGSTAAAALEEGFNCILMESDEAYVEFLHQRFGEKTSNLPIAADVSADLADLL